MTARYAGYPQWHAASVPLDEDEFLAYRGYMILGWLGGDLFLTTKRLIWIRIWSPVPFRRKLVEVPLSDIESWTVERGPRWARFDWLRPGRRTLRVRTRRETLDFVTWWGGEDAEEWAEALEDVMVAAGYATRDSGA